MLQPFSYKLEKWEDKQMFASYLIRAFVIKGEPFYDVIITRSEFKKWLKDAGYTKSKIHRYWSYVQAWKFFQYVTKYRCILVGRRKIIGVDKEWNEIWDKWFLHPIDNGMITFRNFIEIISLAYLSRKVIQPTSIKNDLAYRKKKNNEWYNKVIEWRLIKVKHWRWTRKLAKQMWVTRRTVTNRTNKLIKQKKLGRIRRQSKAFWFRINLTNLYYPLMDMLFIYYNKDLSGTQWKITLRADHINRSLLNKKPLLLNGCLGCLKGNADVYRHAYDLWLLY